MAKKNGIRPEIAGGRTLSRMLRGSKSDGGNKKKGRKQTWFTPATYDILIAEKSAMEGKPIKLLGLGESICIEFNTETGTAVLLPREKVLPSDNE